LAEFFSLRDTCVNIRILGIRVHTRRLLIPSHFPPLGCSNTAVQCLNMSAQLTFNDTKPPLIIFSSRLKLHPDGLMPLHQAIVCVVDHGNHQLQQRRRRSVLRPDIYVYQIMCNQLNRVQILRSISGCWRFKCPRASTVTNALIRLTCAMFKPLTVSKYNKKIKMGFHHSMLTSICGGFRGARRFVIRLWCIICLVTRWGGEEVGGTSTQPPVNVPSGPNDFNIFALKTQPPPSPCHHEPPRGPTVTTEITPLAPTTRVSGSTQAIPLESSTLRKHYDQEETENHHSRWSLIWERLEDVKTLQSKRHCRPRVANERGGHGGGGAST